MRRLLTETDLLPGVIAVLVLIAWATLLRFEFPLALVGLVPAALVYLGLRLLVTRRADDTTAQAADERAQALAQGRAEVARLRALAGRVPAGAVRARVERICGLADRILAAIGEDAKEPRLARHFVGQYLQPTRTVLEEYVPLAVRDVAASREGRRAVEERDLPSVEAALVALYDKVHRGDVIELETASEMLGLSLDGTGTPERRPREER